MDSRVVFTHDKTKFDEDLEELMNSAAATASSNTTTPVRKRLAPEQPAPKRIKLDRQRYVHPSRLALVAQDSSATVSAPDSPRSRSPSMRSERTGSNAVPLGPISKRFQSEPKTKKRDSAISSGPSTFDAPGAVALRQHTESVVISTNRSLRAATDGTVEDKFFLRQFVQRQWDPAQDGFAYEELLEKRRTERLVNVDRYVPSQVSRRACKTAPLNLPFSTPFPYEKLPEKIRAKILTYLLVDNEQIIIDFTWLRPFVNGHSRVPVVDKVIKDDELSVYTVPMSWDQLVKEVGVMQKDCVPFKSALEDRGNKTRKRKAPCRGLSTGALAVSRSMHAQAASILYGKNVFRFPWPSSAWMQLESFLATIGPTNVSKLRNIVIHCPLWHRGVKEDFLEGAVLDLTSPASRLAVVKPPSRDRLLSAITASVEALSAKGKLETFHLDLEHGMNTDKWSGRYRNHRHLLSVDEAEEHVIRKQEGVQLLKSLSESLASPPVVTLYHTTSIAKYDLSEFRSRLASVVREASKYGWQVDQQLKGRRR